MAFNNWQKLMQSFGLPENQKTYAHLIKAYSEKHRYYHTVDHINACLKHLEDSQQLVDNSHEIELALWFHDAIYQPYKKDNEFKSALWAKDFLIANNVNSPITERIGQLIMVTLHDCKTQTKDEALMVDIDLTILGTDPDIYAVFEKNVRKEYKWVPYFHYRKKRKEVLQGFLNKDRIYNTERYFEMFENQARFNIKQAIQAL